MTTGGEGGMLTTDDTEWWKAAWAFKDHGKSFDAVYSMQHPPGFRWLHESFGTNWRITEMQSTIGRIQLRRLDAWKARRQVLAARLDEVLCKHDVVRVPQVPDNIDHAQYKHYAFVCPERLKDGWTRDAIIAALTAKGVPAYQGSCSEVYLERAFDDTGWRPESRLSVAQELGETSLMFLVHPTITDEEIAFVCRELNEVLTAASR